MTRDEERAAFKESEYEAMRRIVAGDLICPDPTAHDIERMPTPELMGLESIVRFELKRRGLSNE